MVSDSQRIAQYQSQTTALRRQAGDLLRRLEASKRIIEQRCAEHGRFDPMTSVTGCSSIDRAIEATREIIAGADRLLSESNGSTRGQTKAAAPEPAIAAR